MIHFVWIEQQRTWSTKRFTDDEQKIRHDHRDFGIQTHVHGDNQHEKLHLSWTKVNVILSKLSYKAASG